MTVPTATSSTTNYYRECMIRQDCKGHGRAALTRRLPEALVPKCAASLNVAAALCKRDKALVHRDRNDLDEA
jgi:hypothetical protein